MQMNPKGKHGGTYRMCSLNPILALTTMNVTRAGTGKTIFSLNGTGETTTPNPATDRDTCPSLDCRWDFDDTRIQIVIPPTVVLPLAAQIRRPFIILEFLLLNIDAQQDGSNGQD